MNDMEVPAPIEEFFDEGRRVGRYVLVRDVEGTLHAISAGAVAAICEVDDGCLAMLPGGRMVTISRSMRTVLGWLEVGTR